jgi:hypothetical protein
MVTDIDIFRSLIQVQIPHHCNSSHIITKHIAHIYIMTNILIVFYVSMQLSQTIDLTEYMLREQYTQI